MATNFVCRICGTSNPRFFTFSLTGKTPLCQGDVGKFMAVQGSAGHSIFPIEAWEFAESPDDLPVFQQRSADAERHLLKLQHFMIDEESDYEQARQTFLSFKREVCSMVENSFREKEKMLEMVHTEVVKCLAQSCQQFENWRSRRSATLDDLSHAIAEETAAGNLKIYSHVLHDVRNEVWSLLSSIVGTPCKNAEELLITCLKSEQSEPKVVRTSTKGAGKTEGKTAGGTTTKPAPKRRTKLGTCDECNNELLATNYVKFEGHEDCVVCLACIDAATKDKLRCPGCDRAYCPKEKLQLKKLLPKMFERIAAEKTKQPLKKRKAGN